MIPLLAARLCGNRIDLEHIYPGQFFRLVDQRGFAVMIQLNPGDPWVNYEMIADKSGMVKFSTEGTQYDKTFPFDWLFEIRARIFKTEGYLVKAVLSGRNN
jgi:hypothetical protein